MAALDTGRDSRMSTIARSASVAAAPAQSILVQAMDASGGGRPVSLSSDQVQSSADPVLKDTVQNASTVMNYFRSQFGRDGIDNRGAQLKVVVHAPDPYGGAMNNAYWDGQAGKMFIGDGDGKMFSPLGRATDIIAHEVGHAILESEIHMGFNGQEGALHESFGDVMGALVDDKDWTIGEETFTPTKKGDSLRDMSKPQKYHHVDDVKIGLEHGEPHQLADIPNLAAFRTAQKIGRQDMGRVWYQGFTENLKDYGKFSDAAAATVKAAEQLFGAGSKQASAVADAWQSVGVLAAAAR